jgi:hypothetical protein
MHDLWNRARPLARVGLVFGGLALFAVIALVFGLLVMWLWNWLMPDLFGLKTLSYWQAWGLVVLAHILFKGGPGRGPHGRPGHGRWHRHGRDEAAPAGGSPAATA